ncbi:unknown [Fusobacterium sp. CAG:439]|nr:unknown [Fusobacterium sp. CAG:439]
MEELIEFKIKQMVEPRNITFQGNIISREEEIDYSKYVFNIIENNEDNKRFEMPNSSNELNKDIVVQIIIAGKERKSKSWEIKKLNKIEDNNEYELIIYSNRSSIYTNKYRKQ